MYINTVFFLKPYNDVCNTCSFEKQMSQTDIPEANNTEKGTLAFNGLYMI